MKRLLGAIVDGFGLAAGKKLFDDAVDDLTGVEDPAKAAERAKAVAAEEKRAAKERATEEKRAAAEDKRAAKERAHAAKQREVEIDRELAAMKKRLGK